MYTAQLWMPCARKWELQERAKAVRAAGQGKAYVVRPYVHTKGKLFANMDSAKLADLKRDALADLDDRPPLDASLSCFDGKVWMTPQAYAMALEHARMIEEAQAAEAEPEALAA